MHRLSIFNSLRGSIHCNAQLNPRVLARLYADAVPKYESKYAEKLQLKAQEQGLDISELKLRAREDLRKKQKEEASKLIPATTLGRTSSNRHQPQPTANLNGRRDSSPVKPLDAILNIPKLVSTPHTAAQISALWTAYHASRTSGTGRGYICASVPIDIYNKMTQVAKRYPLFVVPIPRENTSGISQEDPNQGEGTAHEFYLLQWNFYEPPSSPLIPNPFFPPTSHDADSPPQPSTVLFTPLQEYKLRTSFATPYLVLTFYTDLARTHGIVLLRGEITPSAAVGTGEKSSERFLISQTDAQVLAMELQKFFLWDEGGKASGKLDQTAEDLLKQFHEAPETFSWEGLLRLSRLTL
ncbi:ATP11 protein-domain-containing protein [Hygrophoropsis aurantiaca]|uniref:ATP11 protein-domain-containing protein n=1 Tax=Hygrophoropsis aurantiaca TaxID=72124 RepID=A0ACB8AAQ8_9AGAM|nr:ATP11 protein-domain-containing protein [Hygrophoropsis aurantiaca]